VPETRKRLDEVLLACKSAQVEVRRRFPGMFASMPRRLIILREIWLTLGKRCKDEKQIASRAPKADRTE
jgi:hypothetical protein